MLSLPVCRMNGVDGTPQTFHERAKMEIEGWSACVGTKGEYACLKLYHPQVRIFCFSLHVHEACKRILLS